VTAESVHTACFTKGYGRYIKGTGSILQFLPSSADRETDLPPAEHLQQTASEDETPNMKRQKLEDAEAPQTASAPEDLVTTPQTLETLIGKLRYFTPEELLRLFGFDSPPLSSGSPTVGGFFPIDEKLTLRKKYELIGNSLNVTVASRLLQLLLGSKEGR
jgi:tRNA (cytosine38-C5)-methyltransferase